VSARRWWPGQPRDEEAAPAPEPVVVDPPVQPAFFLSYARATPPSARAAGDLDDPNAGVKELYADLNRRVRHLLPLRAGEEAGFMDDRMETGQLWNEELLRNVGTARVFVALLSPPYLERSEWCPMEWDLFTRRKVSPRPGKPPRANATAVIPILWTPIKDEIPPIVDQVQRFIPTPVLTSQHIQLYKSEGVLGMSDVDRAAYRAIVWAIAREIQEIDAALRVAPSYEAGTNHLRRSFRERVR
jgi:hypothetical protein